MSGGTETPAARFRCDCPQTTTGNDQLHPLELCIPGLRQLVEAGVPLGQDADRRHPVVGDDLILHLMGLECGSDIAQGGVHPLPQLRLGDAESRSRVGGCLVEIVHEQTPHSFTSSSGKLQEQFPSNRLDWTAAIFRALSRFLLSRPRTMDSSG